MACGHQYLGGDALSGPTWGKHLDESSESQDFAFKFVVDDDIEQIVNLASLPFAYKHVAIMPDAHAGKGMPIGGVLATNGVVIPNAVGVDIGCGMCAIKTNLKASDLVRKDLTTVMSHIRETVPLGFDHQQKAVDESLLPDIDLESLPFLSSKKKAMLKEIGTLQCSFAYTLWTFQYY